MIDFRHFGLGRNAQFSKADALAACAARYRRMFGGVRTVGEWNALIDRIAQRSGFNHHTTLTSAKMYYAHRSGSPIFFHDEAANVRGARPYAKFLRRDIEERLSRLKLAIDRRKREREEIEAECRYQQWLRIGKQINEAKETVRLINQATKAAVAAMKEKA